MPASSVWDEYERNPSGTCRAVQLLQDAMKNPFYGLYYRSQCSARYVIINITHRISAGSIAGFFSWREMPFNACPSIPPVRASCFQFDG
jgi:hypothetical protein